jgi:predicted SprT family Zn-dependent metalloprotease
MIVARWALRGRWRPAAAPGKDAKKGQLFLLRVAAAAAAPEACAVRSDALDKAARWCDLSALLPKREKAVRRAAGRRKQQQQTTVVVARGKPGSARRGGRPAWSAGELRLLRLAVRRHGRDWVAVARGVRSKTNVQCKGKVTAEVAAGRMPEPDKRFRNPWNKAELAKLTMAVGQHGRDWAAVSRDVGSKTKQQCMNKVAAEVAAGRTQEPGGKRVRGSWSKAELLRLSKAVSRHGRDWVAVSRDVGRKTSDQCKGKVANEVAAGRMQEPGGKRVKDWWSKVELHRLSKAVSRHGRDWAAVSRAVRSKTGDQCKHKVANEVAAGRMQEPGGKQVQDSWSKAELLRLSKAVSRHGRCWVAVSCDVGSKTKLQCWGKVAKEVAAGRMQEPGGKQVKDSWRKGELLRLMKAVSRHGRDWSAVSCDVSSKTSEQCIKKVATEVAAGHMKEPGGKRVRGSWSKAELLRLSKAVSRHGRDWAAVSYDVGSKTQEQCRNKVTKEVAAGL